MNNDPYLLEVDGVSKTFPGVKALDNVSFNLKKGEVMGLIGENGAGKSTLVKILIGLHQRDNGTIVYKGEPYKVRAVSDALTHGISMIHQELSLVPTMTVAENIWINRERKFSKLGVIQWKKLKHAASELLKSLGLETLPVNKTVSQLSIANQQLVEIARAVSYDVNIVIMDEPTSSLPDAEVDRLYKIIRNLKSRGVSVIYISHKLDEVLSICDRATVMRDGHTVGCREVSELDENKLINMIVGREVDDIYPARDSSPGEVIFEVKNLFSRGIFKNISFRLRKGEVLGFCGLVGAGRTEIMRAIYGLDRYDGGEIFLEGRKVSIRSTSDALRLGIGMVNEDRHTYGILRNISLKHNVSVSDLFELCKYGFINRAKENKKVDDILAKFNVKYVSKDGLIESLSGGNQQKALVGRAMMVPLKVLILDEPTRGIDIGAKIEIYNFINELTKQGMAVIMISSELPELLGVSDRILVIHNGEISGEHIRKDFNEQKIMADAFALDREA